MSDTIDDDSPPAPTAVKEKDRTAALKRSLEEKARAMVPVDVVPSLRLVPEDDNDAPPPSHALAALLECTPADLRRQVVELAFEDGEPAAPYWGTTSEGFFAAVRAAAGTGATHTTWVPAFVAMYAPRCRRDDSEGKWYLHVGRGDRIEIRDLTDCFIGRLEILLDLFPASEKDKPRQAPKSKAFTGGAVKAVLQGIVEDLESHIMAKVCEQVTATDTTITEKEVEAIFADLIEATIHEPPAPYMVRGLMQLVSNLKHKAAGGSAQEGLPPVMIWLEGAADTGKSHFFSCLKRVLPPELRPVSSTTLELLVGSDGQKMIDVHGDLLVNVNEPKVGKYSDGQELFESLKRYIEEDQLKVRLMRENNGVGVERRTHVVFTSNYPPSKVFGTAAPLSERRLVYIGAETERSALEWAQLGKANAERREQADLARAWRGILPGHAYYSEHFANESRARMLGKASTDDTIEAYLGVPITAEQYADQTNIVHAQQLFWVRDTWLLACLESCGPRLPKIEALRRPLDRHCAVKKRIYQKPGWYCFRRTDSAWNLVCQTHTGRVDIERHCVTPPGKTTPALPIKADRPESWKGNFPETVNDIRRLLSANPWEAGNA